MNTTTEKICRNWIGMPKLKRVTIRTALSLFLALFIFEGFHILVHMKIIDGLASHFLVVVFGFTVTMSFSIIATNAIRFALNSKDTSEQLINLNKQLSLSNEILKEVSMKDSLTGLWINRDFLIDTIRRMCSRGKRNGELLVMLFIDGDDFGDINKRYGHVAGDNAIAVISKTISHCMREDDFLFRYGGDEFLALLLLKKTSPQEMRIELDMLKQRIHSSFENISFYHESHRILISVSIGEHFVNMDTMEFKQEIEMVSQKMNEEKEIRKKEKATAN